LLSEKHCALHRHEGQNPCTNNERQTPLLDPRFSHFWFLLKFFLLQLAKPKPLRIAEVARSEVSPAVSVGYGVHLGQALSPSRCTQYTPIRLDSNLILWCGPV
jgi:hypothetical protein